MTCWNILVRRHGMGQHLNSIYDTTLYGPWTKPSPLSRLHGRKGKRRGRKKKKGRAKSLPRMKHGSLLTFHKQVPPFRGPMPVPVPLLPRYFISSLRKDRIILHSTIRYPAVALALTITAKAKALRYIYYDLSPTSRCSRLAPPHFPRAWNKVVYRSIIYVIVGDI